MILLGTVCPPGWPAEKTTGWNCEECFPAPSGPAHPRRLRLALHAEQARARSRREAPGGPVRVALPAKRDTRVSPRAQPMSSAKCALLVGLMGLIERAGLTVLDLWRFGLAMRVRAARVTA